MPYINKDEARILYNALYASKHDFTYSDTNYRNYMYKVKKEYQNLSDRQIKDKIHDALEVLEQRLQGISKDTRRVSKTGRVTDSDDWNDLLLRFACLRIDKKTRCK